MKRIAAMMAVVLVALLVSAGSAQAWEQYPCKVGEVSADATFGRAGTDVTVSMPGRVDCPVSNPGPQFAVVTFRVNDTEGYYHSGMLHMYAKGGATLFTVYGQFPWDRYFDGGLCLMPNENTRLSCVRVTPTGKTNPLVTSLSTSDSLVTKPIRSAGSGQNPNCGGCWRVNP